MFSKINYVRYHSFFVDLFHEADAILNFVTSVWARTLFCSRHASIIRLGYKRCRVFFSNFQVKNVNSFLFPHTEFAYQVARDECERKMYTQRKPSVSPRKQ